LQTAIHGNLQRVLIVENCLQSTQLRKFWEDLFHKFHDTWRGLWCVVLWI
jgi:hypothetical protein